MKTLKTIAIIFFLIFISCHNNTKKYYYDTGEISKEETHINKHTVFVRYFFENGKTCIEGTLIDSLKEGIWKRYYSDGVSPKGDAFFHKGEIVDLKQTVLNNRYKVLLDIENSPLEIKVGQTYGFRFLISGIWNYNFNIPSSKLGVPKVFDLENYPYKITPKAIGIDTIKFYILDLNDNILKTIPYVIKIVK